MTEEMLQEGLPNVEYNRGTTQLTLWLAPDGIPIYQALLQAIENFSEKKTGLPDMVVMNATRRMEELPMMYWETVLYDTAPIELRVPATCGISDIEDMIFTPNLFICLRHEKEPDATT